MAPPTPPRAAVTRGVYLITPDEADTDRLVARVRPLLPHVSLLQYRNKGADAASRRAQVAALLPLCAAHGVPLIINDDWRIAAECGAQGAHLGQADGSLAAARRACGTDAILGASCYDDIDLARSAAASGADYLAFGAFFLSTTKPDARRAGTALLRDARGYGLPLVAIGGITPDNGASLVAAGADLLAVISGVFDAPDPLAAVHAYRACFN